MTAGNKILTIHKLIRCRIQDTYTDITIVSYRPDANREMFTGTVKWFNNDKGYGFVQMDEDGSEVFVHHSAIDMEGFKTLHHGQAVELSLYYGHKGLTASYLKPLDKDNPGKVRVDFYASDKAR